MPDVVRPVADVPGGEVMTDPWPREARAPNEEQLAAIDARGLVFVSAGAGTGKTTVLVERFVRAVCDRGLDVDSVLAITYTERAAGELRGRIRRGSPSSAATISRASSTAPGSRRSTASASAC